MHFLGVPTTRGNATRFLLLIIILTTVSCCFRFLTWWNLDEDSLVLPWNVSMTREYPYPFQGGLLVWTPYPSGNSPPPPLGISNSLPCARYGYFPGQNQFSAIEFKLDLFKFIQYMYQELERSAVPWLHGKLLLVTFTMLLNLRAGLFERWILLPLDASLTSNQC